MKARLALAAAMAGTLVLAAPAPASRADEKAAIDAANLWLELIDSGQIPESWASSASLFREAVSASEWQRALTSARRPFGRLLSRRVRSAQYAESLPGAPDGRYVVIQYDAVYENKKQAVETVTPMYEAGEWKVSGYYIR